MEVRLRSGSDAIGPRVIANPFCALSFFSYATLTAIDRYGRYPETRSLLRVMYDSMENSFAALFFWLGNFMKFYRVGFNLNFLMES